MARLPGRLCFMAGLLFLPWTAPAATPPKSAAGIEFFEGKIRPLLVDNCYKCHSHQSEKVRGGLMLDTKAGLRQGGESGPALIPGNPERSLLFKAVCYTDPDLQMPPKDQKLSDQQIEHLRLWIKMGAPDPRTSETNTVAPLPAEARRHWAFQPVIEPALPKIHHRRNWITSPIDAFVLENLNARNLKPSPPADRRTLIRRATFDLTGLPPTESEVEAFAADKSKDAFSKVVDRLLASPHYGERWGRYWLDVARYADTKGGAIGEIDPILPYAYTYRDYVVRSFNEDLPYNRFIIEQLAADQLPQTNGDNRSLAALGFLTVGRKSLNNNNDIIDDQIDVVSRGLLGLTASCARCHDHKFDPIPTRDYYSLHGIFNSSVEPTNLPLLTVPRPAGYSNYLAEVGTQEKILNEFVTSNVDLVLLTLRTNTGDYLLGARDSAAFFTNSLKLDEFVRARKLNKSVLTSWRTNLLAMNQKTDPIFAPWFAFASVPTNEWKIRAAPLAKEFSLRSTLDPLVAKLFSTTPMNLNEVARGYGRLFASVPIQPESEPGSRALQEFAEAEHSPLNPPRDQFRQTFLFDMNLGRKIKELERRVTEVEATNAGAPPRAMVLFDRPVPFDSHIFVRGDAGTRGAVAPREFLQILCPNGQTPFSRNVSGRLQLAGAIASPDNPLTARVLVNRVWMHHFGVPLVATPSDFGVRTAKPVQARLLDYLAARFVADGWSVKKLQRLIMLSSVYEQDSGENVAAMKLDPDNDYLWRMNPQRLDFEAMRDSMLAVAGALDSRVGGQPQDISSAVNTNLNRRTLYGLVDRANLPDFFRTFDFANPDTTSAGRFETVVAPQALFLLNSPLVTHCANGLVERARANEPASDAARIGRMYEILFQREPSSTELGIAENYLTNQPDHDAIIPETTAWEYGSGTVDEANGKIADFAPLAVFNGNYWLTRGSKADALLGPVKISATGGLTGRGTSASVRRWVAPRDGRVSVSGPLALLSTNSHGIRGWIISSRTGLVAQWQLGAGFGASQVEASAMEIDVKEGDALDFAVDNVAGGYPSAYRWAPVLEMAKGVNEEMGLPHVWNATDNFVDPRKVRRPLGPWEKYAQVLLFSNEFFYIE